MSLPIVRVFTDVVILLLVSSDSFLKYLIKFLREVFVFFVFSFTSFLGNFYSRMTRAISYKLDVEICKLINTGREQCQLKDVIMNRSEVYDVKL